VRKSWSKVTIDKIVADICAEFGVGSYVQDPGPAFEAFSVQADEMGIDTIQRAATKRGLYVYSVGGDLVLARAGAYRTKTVLERGKNLVWSRRSDSWYSRYSDYVFRGQVRPTDGNWGKNANQLSTTVKDEEINRFRPLRVQAEAHDGLDLKTRATLECNQRAGRGERIVCLVDDWLTDEGTAWRPNTLVRYKNPPLGIDATMLIAVARYRFGPTEARGVELELCHPDAFDIGKYRALGRGEQWS
jgi:prophage tail gpP-like protein